MLRLLVKLIQQAGAANESDTKRDGFLSYAAETHALGHGAYGGLTSRPWQFRSSELPDNEDVQAESHYFKGAYVLGTILQWIIIMSLVATGYGL